MVNLVPNDPADTIARANAEMERLHQAHTIRNARVTSIHPDGAVSPASRLENAPQFRAANARLESARDATRVGDEGARALNQADVNAFR